MEAENLSSKYKRLKTPLAHLDSWKTVSGFLTPRNEKKFNRAHQSFGPIATNYRQVSFCNPWLLFAHFGSGKLFVENVSEETEKRWYLLRYAADQNDNGVEVTTATIEGGAEVEAKFFHLVGRTALYFAAVNNNFEFARVLIPRMNEKYGVRFDYTANVGFENMLTNAIAGKQ